MNDEIEVGDVVEFWRREPIFDTLIDDMGGRIGVVEEKGFYSCYVRMKNEGLDKGGTWLLAFQGLRKIELE